MCNLAYILANLGARSIEDLDRVNGSKNAVDEGSAGRFAS